MYDIAPDNAIKTGATRPGSMIDKLMRYINRHVYKNAENVIVLGTEMKNYLLNHQISKNADNIHVIPNWYDMRQLQDNRIYNDTFKASVSNTTKFYCIAVIWGSYRIWRHLSHFKIK